MSADSTSSFASVRSPLAWGMHRCAMARLDKGLPAPNLQQSVRWLQGADGSAHLDFLVDHGLAAWWADSLAQQSALGELPEAVRVGLIAARRTAGALYLMQSAALSQITAVLERENVIYAVLKGAATREEAYVVPALRTAGDIDLLISPSAFAAVTQCITQLGFVAQPTTPHRYEVRLAGRWGEHPIASDRFLMSIRSQSKGRVPNMKKSLNMLLIGCAAFVLLTVVGCEKKGPMEKAGEKVDEAAKKTGDAVKIPATGLTSPKSRP